MSTTFVNWFWTILFISTVLWKERHAASIVVSKPNEYCITDQSEMPRAYSDCLEDVNLPSKKLKAKHMNRTTICILADRADECLKKITGTECYEFVESQAMSIPIDIRLRTAAAILKYACFKFEDTKRVIKSSKTICQKFEVQSCFAEMMKDAERVKHLVDKRCKLVRSFVKCAKKSSMMCKPKMRRTLKEVMRFVLDSYDCAYCGVL